MAALQFLTQRYQLGLTGVGMGGLPARVREREVTVLMRASGVSGVGRGRAETLVVVSAEEIMAGGPAEWMRRAAGCAAVVVVCGPGESVPSAVRDAAVRAGVLLLAGAADGRWVEAEVDLLRARVAALEVHAGRVERLEALAAGPGGLGRVVRWLAGEVRGQVVVADRHAGTVLSSAEVRGQAAGDRVGAAPAVSDGAPELRDEVLGAEPGDARGEAVTVPLSGVGPGMVLAVRSAESGGEMVGRLARFAGQVLTHRLGRQEADATPIATTTYRLLMQGLAGPAAEALDWVAPGMLPAEAVVVYVVDVAGGRPAESGEGCETWSAERAAVCAAVRRRMPTAVAIPDPDRPRQVVILRFLHTVAEVGADEQDALYRYVAGVPELRLGASNRWPPEQLRAARAQAGRALSAAGVIGSLGRAVEYAAVARADLAAAVDERVWGWALARLAPVLLDRGSRVQVPAEVVLTTVLHELQFGVDGAARALGVDPGTVTRRRDRMAALLGIDLRRRLRDRAEVYLALTAYAQAPGVTQISDLKPLAPAEARAALAGVLGLEQVQAWAEAVRAPLSRHPVWEETVRAWVHADGSTKAAGVALGVEADTVAKRLRQVQAMLGKDDPAAGRGGRGPGRGGPPGPAWSERIPVLDMALAVMAEAK